MYEGALDTMFPAGALGLVDEIRIRTCSAQTGINSLARKVIAANLPISEPAAVSVDQLRGLMDRYYVPLFADDAARQLRALGKSMPAAELRIIVSGDGILSSQSMIRPRGVFDGILAEHSGSWRFPPVNGAVPVTLTFTISSASGVGHGPAERL